MNRFLVSAVLICGTVAVLAPRLEGVGEDEATQVNVVEVNSADPQQANAGADWYDGGTTLDRGHNGHFYADAYVEGTRVNFMVDTGASVIALTGADAMAAGLHWDEAKVRPIGSGASGTVYGVEAMLKQVEVGGIVQQDVPAVIIPEGLEISLLGQSFLQRLNNVTIEGDRMVLGG